MHNNYTEHVVKQLISKTKFNTLLGIVTTTVIEIRFPLGTAWYMYGIACHQYGIRMVFAWYCVVFVWLFTWHLYGVRILFAWSLYRYLFDICMVPAQYLHGYLHGVCMVLHGMWMVICIVSSWYLHGICMVFALYYMLVVYGTSVRTRLRAVLRVHCASEYALLSVFLEPPSQLTAASRATRASRVAGVVTT